MRIDVLTVFPEFVRHSAELGVIGRAQRRGLLEVVTWNPRDLVVSGYRSIDDRVYGGGPGVVLAIDPIRDCLKAARAASPVSGPTIHLSPQGQLLSQARVRELAALPRIFLLCGRYEGIDERLLSREVDCEISIGDYVLSGGELAAAVLIDAIGRVQTGALTDSASADEDSFENGLLDCPHYTRPEVHELGEVPAVLRSGDHAAIRLWRRKQSLGRTWLRRPDLLARRDLNAEERSLLAEFQCDWHHRPRS